MHLSTHEYLRTALCLVVVLGFSLSFSCASRLLILYCMNLVDIMSYQCSVKHLFMVWPVRCIQNDQEHDCGAGFDACTTGLEREDEDQTYKLVQKCGQSMSPKGGCTEDHLTCWCLEDLCNDNGGDYSSKPMSLFTNLLINLCLLYFVALFL